MTLFDDKSRWKFRWFEIRQFVFWVDAEGQNYWHTSSLLSSFTARTFSHPISDKSPSQYSLWLFLHPTFSLKAMSHIVIFGESSPACRIVPPMTVPANALDTRKNTTGVGNINAQSSADAHRNIPGVSDIEAQSPANAPTISKCIDDVNVQFSSRGSADKKVIITSIPKNDEKVIIIITSDDNYIDVKIYYMDLLENDLRNTLEHLNNRYEILL